MEDLRVYEDIADLEVQDLIKKYKSAYPKHGLYILSTIQENLLKHCKRCFKIKDGKLIKELKNEGIDIDL